MVTFSLVSGNRLFLALEDVNKIAHGLYIREPAFDSRQALYLNGGSDPGLNGAISPSQTRDVLTNQIVAEL